jgi:hypothetical protein
MVRDWYAIHKDDLLHMWETQEFNDDGTFNWHEDQSADGADMVFEWVPVQGE